MKRFSFLIFSVIAASCYLLHATTNQATDEKYIFLPGKDSVKKNKNIVFIAAEHEYRTEQAFPMLAQILSEQGFDCTVLFALDKEGKFNPDQVTSLDHYEKIKDADLLVLGLRFRNWNDDVMKTFQEAIDRGVGVIGVRTSTHAFKFDSQSAWARYDFQYKMTESPSATDEKGKKVKSNLIPDDKVAWSGGFGRTVLGESWAGHHGHHRFEGTRTFTEQENAKHPVLLNVGQIFVTTDTYGAHPKDPSTILLRGGVTKTLSPTSPLLEGEKNNPMMPVAWVREYTNEAGKTNRVFTTTMGAGVDFLDEQLRRLFANAVYWTTGLEVPDTLDVTLPGKYQPRGYQVGKYNHWKPAQFLLSDK